MTRAVHASYDAIRQIQAYHERIVRRWIFWYRPLDLPHEQIRRNGIFGDSCI